MKGRGADPVGLVNDGAVFEKHVHGVGMPPGRRPMQGPPFEDVADRPICCVHRRRIVFQQRDERRNVTKSGCRMNGVPSPVSQQQVNDLGMLAEDRARQRRGPP